MLEAYDEMKVFPNVISSFSPFSVSDLTFVIYSMCETAAGSECAPLLAQAQLQWTQLSRPLPH